MPSRWKGPTAAAVTVAGLLTGCGTHATAGGSRPAGHSSEIAPAAASHSAEASRSRCGRGWSHADAGGLAVLVHNTDSDPAEVYLADRAGRIFGELDPLAPGASGTLRSRVAAGSYHLVCAVTDADPVNGPNVAVAGSADGVRGVRPVTSAQLAPYVIGYQHWVTRRLKSLSGQAAGLDSALRRGDRSAARAAWRRTDRTWNTMGGAYEAFGATGDAVDGTAYAQPGGVHDQHWTGLLAIEYGLWHHRPMTGLRRLGRRLRVDLRALDRELRGAQFAPLDVVNRTHEITEDSLGQTLTGHQDYGAHAELTEVSAQLDGTSQLLRRLHPLIAARYPGSRAVTRQIAKSKKDVGAQHAWQVPTAGAPVSRGHRLVDSDLSQLAELLTPIPTTLEPRVG